MTNKKEEFYNDFAMLMDKTIAVVVPAYNEERLIFGVLRTIPTFVDHIIAVNDGSIDQTHRVIELAQAENPCIKSVVHTENRGVGAAIISGYEYAMELNADIIAVMAGDGQMDAGDLYRIIEPVALGEVDYAKGDRFIMPAIRVFGGLLLSYLTAFVTGYKVSDSQSGFTAINRETLRLLPLDRIYRRYGMPNDMLIKLSKVGARIKNVQTAPVYGHGEQSGIKVYKVVWPILFILGRGLWQRMKVCVIGL